MTSVHRRIEQLFDPRSFEPFDPENSVGYICGQGLIEGRKTYVCAAVTDPQPCTPSDSMRKKVRFLEHILTEPAPVIFLVDVLKSGSTSTGHSPVPPDSARLQAGKDGVGRSYCLHARLQKTVPLVGVLFGQVAAALSFPLTLCDTIAMVEGSAMCIGRPDAVKVMIGETPSMEELGGARMHCTVSGLGDALVPSEDAALQWVRRYLSYFPLRTGEAPPSALPLEPSPWTVPPETLVPRDCLKPFDMNRLAASVIDAGSLLELKALHAREAITALARVGGRVAGLVANNSAHLGGILFPATCRKIARFISLCEAFGIPLIFLVDTPGFMVGKQAEADGILKDGANLFATIARCRSPRLCLVVRKAYTAGLYAMAGSGFDPVKLLALPTASIAVYGRKALERFAREGNLTEAGREALREMLQEVENPERLLEKGLIEGVIQWDRIRAEIASFLESTRSRRD